MGRSLFVLAFPVGNGENGPQALSLGAGPGLPLPRCSSTGPQVAVGETSRRRRQPKPAMNCHTAKTTRRGFWRPAGLSPSPPHGQRGPAQSQREPAEPPPLASMAHTESKRHHGASSIQGSKAFTNVKPEQDQLLNMASPRSERKGK